jgi:hypothetical protein
MAMKERDNDRADKLIAEGRKYIKPNLLRKWEGWRSVLDNEDVFKLVESAVRAMKELSSRKSLEEALKKAAFEDCKIMGAEQMGIGLLMEYHPRGEEIQAQYEYQILPAKDAVEGLLRGKIRLYSKDE